jgi:hypothetical protein
MPEIVFEINGDLVVADLQRLKLLRRFVTPSGAMWNIDEWPADQIYPSGFSSWGKISAGYVLEPTAEDLNGAILTRKAPEGINCPCIIS